MLIEQRWKEFLLSQQATLNEGGRIALPAIADNDDKRIYAPNHLGILSVSGADAAQLLQGQITCNVHELTPNSALFAAQCNPKGRVITTFLLVKQDEGFLLVLPQVLLELVKKRLQMYVLRSKVTITDSSDALCLLGLSTSDAPQQQFTCHTQNGSVSISVSKQQNRRLIIANPEQAIALWQDHTVNQGFTADTAAAWQYLDIADGIPWLNLETTEEYIPQMLNIDKLGGISFNKGCYTGQEIVARTHYLGKAKRSLFIAKCDSTEVPAPNSTVLTDNGQVIGNVLAAQLGQNGCFLQIVLSIPETDLPKLTLADLTPLTLLI